jgi:hypothetical protein
MKTALIAAAIVVIVGCSGGGTHNPALPPALSTAINRTLRAKSLEVAAVAGQPGQPAPKGIDTESIYNAPDRVAVVTSAGQTIIDIGNASYLSASSGLPGQAAATAGGWFETKPHGLKQLAQAQVFGLLRVAAAATTVTGSGPTYSFSSPRAHGTVTIGGGWVTGLVVTTTVTTKLTYSTFDAAPGIGPPVSQITVLPAADR